MKRQLAPISAAASKEEMGRPSLLITREEGCEPSKTGIQTWAADRNALLCTRAHCKWQTEIWSVMKTIRGGDARELLAHQPYRPGKVLMFGRNDITRSRAGVVFLLGLTVLALYLCYLLVAPFLKPILFALIFAVVFYPAHAEIRRWIRNRNIAAALSTVAAILLIISFSFFVGRALVSGLHDIYDSLTGSRDGKEHLSVFIVQLFNRAITWASHYISISVPNLQGAIVSQVEKAVASLLAITAGLIGSLSSFGFNALIAIFILFFLLRDGRSMLRRATVVLPLKPDQVHRLFALMKETLHAIVYGTLVMAAIQGTLTGLAFWLLGLTSPVVWGVLASLLAVLPVVGTTLVWLPAACMLLLSGHWIKGVLLLIWGVAVVHPVDNVLRPYLIGERAKLSTLYVFFALLGGLKTFGGLGVFVGPLILAVTAALFRFLREEKRAGNWGFQKNFAERAGRTVYRRG
jgi:predicted PurR-regulated permease PerM